MKLITLNNIRHHIGLVRSDKALIPIVLKFDPITSYEKHLLQHTWPNLEFCQIDLMWNRIYKHFRGFSPYYLGAFQGEMVLRAFNPKKQLLSLENKAMCDVWFPEIPYPEVVVRCFDNVLYDRYLNIIDMRKAMEIIKREDEIVVKPSVDSMQGSGVYKLKTSDINEDIIFRGGNIIIQKACHQEQTIAGLNPTSINCCRITSLYMGGVFDYSSMIKIGKIGSHLDNWHSSYLIGMSKDGYLLDSGYDKTLNEVKYTDNGIKFVGIKVPGFDLMIELVERCHKLYFPFCGIIGWDVFINSEGKPTVIEANLVEPGLVGEQFVSGPFFEPYVGISCGKLKHK